MTVDAPTFMAKPSKPKLTLPRGACDAHVHVFGPGARFPYASGRATTPADAPAFRHLLGDGSQIGIELAYAVQPKPDGLAQAFTIGRDFIGRDGVAMVLGDNLFYGGGFATLIQAAARRKGATIFGYWVRDPARYGVVELDARGRPVSIAEKPKRPKSNCCRSRSFHAA